MNWTANSIKTRTVEFVLGLLGLYWGIWFELMEKEFQHTLYEMLNDTGFLSEDTFGLFFIVSACTGIIGSLFNKQHIRGVANFVLCSLWIGVWFCIYIAFPNSTGVPIYSFLGGVYFFLFLTYFINVILHRHPAINGKKIRV